MALCNGFVGTQLRQPAFTEVRRPGAGFFGAKTYIEASQIVRKERTRRRHVAQRKKGQDGTQERPRLSVYRSNNHIYAQVIDDTAGHTLAAVSSLTPVVRESLKAKVGANKEAAELVGKKIAELCLSRNIDRVFLDRGGLQYHGRIQALAEAAREGGLLF